MNRSALIIGLAIASLGQAAAAQNVNVQTSGSAMGSVTGQWPAQNSSSTSTFSSQSQMSDREITRTIKRLRVAGYQEAGREMLRSHQVNDTDYLLMRIDVKCSKAKYPLENVVDMQWFAIDQDSMVARKSFWNAMAVQNNGQWFAEYAMLQVPKEEFQCSPEEVLKTITDGQIRVTKED